MPKKRKRRGSINVKKIQRIFKEKGFISFILIILAALAFLLTSGFASSIDQSPEGTRYIVVSPSTTTKHDSLQINTLALISESPTPTPTPSLPPTLPSDNPGSSPPGPLPVSPPLNCMHISATSASPITVTVDKTSPCGKDEFGTGATHTQNDAYFSGNSQVSQYYQNALVYQNAFIMGWGTDDPEPSSGNFNFGSLDARVQLMQQTNAQSIISFCCSPGWMRPAGRGNDWTYLETAPSQANDGNFAQLAATAAKRYPQVKYFQVWNELKGMWGSDPDATAGVGNRWDYERYTKLYNAVWDAVKAVRPDAYIGGPYIGIDGLSQREEDVITYWLKNKHGADFIVLDGGTTPNGTAADFDNSYFSTLTTWVRQQPGGATLPIVWAEWYARVAQTNQSAPYYAAVYANDIVGTVVSGAQWGLLWGTTGDTNQGTSTDTGIPELMLTSQGTPSPLYNAMLLIKNNFPPGTQLYNATVSSSNITALASQTKVLLINHTGAQQSVSVNGTTVTLSAYQVTVVSI